MPPPRPPPPAAPRRRRAGARARPRLALVRQRRRRQRHLVRPRRRASPACSGPNGAGKSTLLHMMAGLLAPSAGERPGRRASRPGDDPAMYRQIGLVPEREAVHAYLTGREFVRLNARLQGVADPDAAAARAIATVDLTDAADRPIGTYSKGMRQRAKLAGALVHEPTVLLLDEPFNGMDPRQRLHMMDLLRVDGRGRPDDPVLVAHPRGGRAAGRRRPRRLRRPAGRGRRLPLDPPADDRPAAHVHGPLVGRPAARRGAAGRARRSSGPSWSTAGSSIRTADFAAFTRAPAARRARRRDHAVRGRARPTTRSRASSATWCADDRVHRAARRRHPARAARPPPDVLMILLAGLPGPARRCSSGCAAAGRDVDRVLDTLRRPDRHAAGRAGLRDGRPRLGARGRDRRLPAGQADPALADRAGEDPRGGRPDRGPGRPVGDPDGRSCIGRGSSDAIGVTLAFAVGCLIGWQRLRVRVRDPQRVHVAGAHPRPRLRPDLGGRPSRAARRGPGSCRSARRRSASSTRPAGR